MSIKGLSKAASALALVGVVAPFLVQSVGAADEPTSALSGVDNVSDPSGSQIIDKAAVPDANGSGKITGNSYAGIGFTSGDLILYQVPNFDFSMDNKIAAHTYNMIAASNNKTSNRMAVIVDNRYTQKDATAKDGKSLYNWSLNAQADTFKPQGVTPTEENSLTNQDVNVLINDTGSLTYNIPVSQNVKDGPDTIYAPGTTISDPTSAGLTLAADKGNTDILSDDGGLIAKEDKSKAPGPTAINFANIASAEFVVLPGSTTAGVAKIIPDTKYVSNITWTLSAAPLH